MGKRRCLDCAGKGWDVYNEDPEAGYLGEVQRCDTCKMFATENEAWAAASASGLNLAVREIDDGYGGTRLAAEVEE